MPGGTSDRTETTTQEGALLPRARRVGVVVVMGRALDGGGSPEAGRVISFESTLEIGRTPEATRGGVTCALADNRVSGRHASVTRGHGDELKVKDLGSKNGTLVNGRPIAGTVKVGDGTLLFLGGHALMLRLLSQDSLAAIREDLAAPLGPMPTLSGKMALAIRRLRRLATTAEAILLLGETGVGKEVYARAVHRASGRRGALVAVSCAAVTAEQLDGELFGHASSGRAGGRKRGRLDEAEGGTLFLDKIDEMPAAVQAKLLRFLDEGKYLPSGSDRPCAADVRVIGATANLAHITHGLRADLLAQFGAEPVVLPPLRERREDLGSLTRHFLGQMRGLETSAFLALCLHDWPQNVRELESVIGQATLLGDGKRDLRLAALPARLQERISVEGPAEARQLRRDRPDKAELRAAIERHHGNLAQVARELDRQWAVVWRWAQQDGIEVEKYRE
jgi:DNA-binding NtrC family response regulator